MTARAEQALLTASEVADRLRITPATVYRMCERNELECVRVGPWLKRIPQAAVDAYLARQTSHPTAR